jgi:hypothetical protein
MIRRILWACIAVAAAASVLFLSTAGAQSQTCPPGTDNPPYCENTGPTGATGSTGSTGPIGVPSVTLAPPIFETSADLARVSGTVYVKLPGASSFTLVTSAINIPFGTIIDARHGKVTLTFQLPHGGYETGTFYGGEFKITQSSKGTLILTLVGGSFAGCPAPPHPTNTTADFAAAHKKKPKTVIRQLWGNAHGSYQTNGRYGSASVGGTIWLTQDRCDGTFVKVTKDNVFVVAYAHPHHRHNVHKGRHYLVPAPGYG